jgi:hypothetical protein
MFMLSFFEIPKGVKKRLDFYRSRFFWQNDQLKRKYRLTKWNIICRPKEQGGLGVEILELKNRCLLSKWLYKLLNEEGVWQELLHNKYLKNKTLSQVTTKPTDSPFWEGLMRVKDDFFSRGSFTIGNGQQVRFWEDIWLGDAPLASQYPSLYNIVRRKNVLVADVLSNTPLNIEFRRTLTGNKWDAWIALVQRLILVTLSEEKDIFVWKLTTSGSFTVKSMYEDYMNGHTIYLRKYIWKLKIPLKVKIFMWFLHRKVILTKDNLARRNWNGCMKCAFCDSSESINHLFFDCPFAKLIWRVIQFTFNIVPPTNVTNMFGNWLNGVDKVSKFRIRIGFCALMWAIWNCRNDIVFNKSTNSNFLQVTRMVSHWIHEWSLLLPETQREPMHAGCRRLDAVARAIYNQDGWRPVKRLSDV